MNFTRLLKSYVSPRSEDCPFPCQMTRGITMALPTGQEGCCTSSRLQGSYNTTTLFASYFLCLLVAHFPPLITQPRTTGSLVRAL